MKGIQSMQKPKFRAAAASVPSQPGEKKKNLELIRERCGELSRHSPRLILFPELSAVGFLPNHPTKEHQPWLFEGMRKVREWSETIPGPTTDALVQIAGEFDVMISAGLFEDAGPLVHNTQVLVCPDGILGVTRKMHIPLFEAPFYNGGGPPIVAETPLGRIGTSICFDTMLPESTRLLQIENAELVLFPFASDPEPRTVEGWIENNAMLLRTRCMENGFFGLVCNYAGRISGLGEEMHFPGGGMLIGPKGQLIEVWRGEAPGSMIAEIDPGLLAEARSGPEFGPRFRRPELYEALVDPLG